VRISFDEAWNKNDKGFSELNDSPFSLYDRLTGKMDRF
jgi:hypothetical protein